MNAIITRPELNAEILNTATNAELISIRGKLNRFKKKCAMRSSAYAAQYDIDRIANELVRRRVEKQDRAELKKLGHKIATQRATPREYNRVVELTNKLKGE